MTCRDVQACLRSLANPADAKFLAGFFKTAPGQYGQGDRFLGVRVPATRKVARQFKDLPLCEVEQLLHSPVHEDRLAALVILVTRFDRADAATRGAIYRLYLANTRFINNWDLVDVSAPRVVGAHLANKSRRPLYRLARSRSLWERRIAVLATFWFIREGDCEDSLRLAERLLADREDLIHKAVGWMLREVGKKDLAALETFLCRHCRTMPRTMLRYAIERLPPGQRRRFMSGG